MGSLRSISSKEVHAAVARLAEAIRERHPGNPELWLIGIANGGIGLARRLGEALGGAGLTAKTGTLDISFHRDDLGRRPIPKEFSPTLLPGDVTGSTVILVDDVLFSGRTAKAALDELFDHGRPARVELAVLVDRGGRLLPIAADYVGLTLEAAPEDDVVVTVGAGDGSRDGVRVAPARRKSA